MNAQFRLFPGIGLLLAGIAVVATAFAGAARAEMFIRLKDGRVLSVPVDRDEIGAITYGNAAESRPAAQRAADRIREDARQVRFASEAAEKAASAAARAEAAARTAAAAAEEARAAREEARAAAEAARDLAQQPPAPSDIPHPAKSPQASEPGASGRKAPGPAKPAQNEPATPPLRLPGIASPELPSPSAAPVPTARVLKVGAGTAYPTPGLAAKAARDGDIVEIRAGTYRGDVAVWQANNLVIRGVGGRVLLDAAGASAEGKAIWVVKGNNTTVENVAFTNARVRDMNGAGIRLEGTGLVVRACAFFDNQMGILTGANDKSDVLIERSRFYRNAVDYPRHGRLGHNIYIGEVRSFTLRFSHVSGARYGHNVKSRARRNTIAYNMIADGDDGRSSYLVDLPSGGTSAVIGNVLHQGPSTENHTMLSFGAENPQASEDLHVVNNTFVNARHRGIFVQRNSVGRSYLSNNILAGGGTVLSGDGEITANLVVDDRHDGRLGVPGAVESARPGTGPLKGNLVARAAGFVDSAKMDFRLAEGSPAIDAGIRPPAIEGGDLSPLFHYVPPMGSVQRPADEKIDIGAYEYTPAAAR